MVWWIWLNTSDSCCFSCNIEAMFLNETVRTWATVIIGSTMSYTTTKYTLQLYRKEGGGMQVVIYMTCSYVFVEFINVKNEDQVSSKVDICFFLCALYFSIEINSQWKDFFDFQFSRTTFLATTREISKGFLCFCGMWISEMSPRRHGVGEEGIL